MDDKTDDGRRDMAGTGEPVASRVGPLRVSTHAADVEAFRRQTGWSEAGDETEMRRHVPHTFPIRWLSSSEISAIIEARVMKCGGVAIHESQNFTYEKPLDVNADYLMTAEIDEQMNPSRLVLRTSIAAQSQETVLRMETVLRLISSDGKS